MTKKGFGDRSVLNPISRMKNEIFWGLWAFSTNLPNWTVSEKATVYKRNIHSRYSGTRNFDE
jgi:hypothetical protein